MKLGGNMISFKTTLKSYGVIVICFCAVFLETLFLSYLIDLKALDCSSFTETQLNVYNAQISLCKMMNLIAILILGLFSFVLLFFSIERFIDENKSNMGVLKALGYTSNKISISLMKYFLPVLLGSILGYVAAIMFSKIFYQTMNKDHIYPDVYFSFNFLLFILFVFTLPLITLSFSYVIGRIKLRTNPLDMINQVKKTKKIRTTKVNNFLSDTRRTVLKNNIILIVFVGFSTLCFSSNIQMAFTMYYQANTSPLFFWMILLIGLLLGFTIMILAFKFVFTNNKKYLSIFKAFGYKNKECYYAVYGGYFIVAIISFILGTLYQALIMSIMFKVFASTYEIKYHFDLKALGFSIMFFSVIYIGINLYYYLKINKLKLECLNVDLG